MTDRKYVMVEATEQEKKKFKEGALLRGFKAVAQWFRFLAYRDLRNLKLRGRKDEQSKEGIRDL